METFFSSKTLNAVILFFLSDLQVSDFLGGFDFCSPPWGVSFLPLFIRSRSKLPFAFESRKTPAAPCFQHQCAAGGLQLWPLHLPQVGSVLALLLVLPVPGCLLKAVPPVLTALVLLLLVF
jgi:hypothetical protein